jgi:hypothetical protein
MRVFRLFAAFSLLMLVASCASVGKLSTPSTKPEITINGADKQKVLDALVAWSATQGRQVEATTQYSVTVTGAMPARTSNNVLWDETVMARTMYTPVVKGNDVTLFAQRLISYVKEENVHSNVGSNRVVGRTTQDITEDYNSQRAYEELQIELESFSQFFAQNK